MIKTTTTYKHFSRSEKEVTEKSCCFVTLWSRCQFSVLLLISFSLIFLTGIQYQALCASISIQQAMLLSCYLVYPNTTVASQVCGNAECPLVKSLVHNDITIMWPAGLDLHTFPTLLYPFYAIGHGCYMHDKKKNMKQFKWITFHCIHNTYHIIIRLQVSLTYSKNKINLIIIYTSSLLPKLLSKPHTHCHLVNEFC